MKYFIKGKIECGYSDIDGISLHKIFSISKQENMIVFTEECDGYFGKEYTKEQAIELLNEAILWIERD